MQARAARTHPWYTKEVPRRQEDQDDEGFGEASRYTAHLDRGWSLLDRGDFQQARNSAHQALKIRPEVPDGAMLMAAISLAESDPESSLEWYERAIDADAEYVDAQLAAAQILLYDLDEPQRALSRAEMARELDEATLADQLDLGVLEVEALVGMGDWPTARERLGNLGELSVLEQLLSPETEREDLRRALEQFVGGEPFDLDDDWEPVVHRAIQLAVRVARLYMDLGAAEAAVPWLDRLLRSFGDDPDIWYLANEAAYIAGDPVKAAQSALQVLQLDAALPAPQWCPTPSELHHKVVDLLLECPDPQLGALAREPGFAIVVNEAPPFELVLEGVDPRVRSVALAARNIRDTEAPPALTGLALYRRNLLRLARDPATFDRELQLAVFDELCVFFGFDDTRRERLGLPPSEWGPLPGDPRSPRRDLDHDDPRRKLAHSRGELVEPTAEASPAASVEPEPAKPAKKATKRKKKAGSKTASKTASKAKTGKKRSAKSAGETKAKTKTKSKAKTKPATTRKSKAKPTKLLDGKAKAKKPEDKPTRKRAGKDPHDE